VLREQEIPGQQGTLGIPDPKAQLEQGIQVPQALQEILAPQDQLGKEKLDHKVQREIKELQEKTGLPGHKDPQEIV
jgi:hypothetical protein